ncbi:MAG TPA: 3-methyl-2-oxobutanoate hydroxymethyltransferase [Anaeromyxobacteraceae bacterium]|nr:3-methyl-2-oxobutanoate hydroxymethyltransferase [Anaeromyxobacteraceae bacterium]
MSSQTGQRKRLTSLDLRAMKANGAKIAMVTAYDASMARLVDEAGADAILVGDSLGMVFQGHDSTLAVTLEQMVYHTAAVRRGLARSSGRAHLTADMPFGSYQASADEAVKAAVRLVAEGGAEAVKLEGGEEFAGVVRRIVRAGVPVMGHLGLTPQSVHALGGYRVQGKDAEEATRLLRDARALADAGCFALVLECIPAELARLITGQLALPTIGIGAGPACDGQVLVLNDLLGLDSAFKPKFVRRFADLSGSIAAALGSYVGAVRDGSFPAEEHSFHAPALRLIHAVETGVQEDAQVVGAPV